MFDIGGWELFVIAALALIVVGPKDLPRLVRNVGKWVAKARSLAREFQTGMEDAAREADLDEVRKVGDVRQTFEQETRKIGSDTKRMLDEQVAGRASPRSSAPEPKRQTEGAARRENADGAGLDADDDALLKNFERGVRSGGFSARSDD